jgi:hypothetical protein
MKKFKLTLAVFMWLFTFCVFGLAQTTNTAEGNFAEFKSDKYKLLGNSSNAKIILSVLTQKQSNNSGKLDFIIYGKMAGYRLELQPVKVKNSLVEKLGEKTISESKPAANEIARNTFAEPTTIIPILQEANAIEITWTLKNSYQSASSKIIVPIGAEPELTTVKFTLPKENNSVNRVNNKLNVKFNDSFVGRVEECNCILVELTTSTCRICKYCANYIDNVLNGVECTAKCGTECTNRECRQPNCGLS